MLEGVRDWGSSSSRFASQRVAEMCRGGPWGPMSYETKTALDREVPTRGGVAVEDGGEELYGPTETICLTLCPRTALTKSTRDGFRHHRSVEERNHAQRILDRGPPSSAE